MVLGTQYGSPWPKMGFWARNERICLTPRALASTKLNGLRVFGRVWTTSCLAMASNMISFYFLCILRKVQHILQRLCFFICTWSIFFENFDLVLFGFIWFYLFPHPDDHLPGDVAQNDDFYFISYFILLFFILFLIYLFPYQDAHLSGNGVNHVDFLYLISYSTLFYFNPYLFIYLFIYLFPYPDDHFSGDGFQYVFFCFLFCFVIFLYLFI